MQSVHRSPYAGTWYPGEAEELEKLLDGAFERSLQRTGVSGRTHPLAFLVPHAGLAYSGTVAAAAYRALGEARPSRVVLLGFSHQGGPRGVALPDVERIATPLGAVAIDRDTAHALASSPPFTVVPESEVCDHSVEIQLPLLQRAVPGVPVLPLYVGPLGPDEREAAARVLASLAGAGTVFLASSDLTHYGRSFHFLPFPPDSGIHERLRDLDFGVLDAAGSLDCELFLDHLAHTGSTACGYAPVALLLRTLALLDGEEAFQEVLDYQTSAQITGDVQHSVSYAAAGYYRASSFRLVPEDQALLLASARATLVHLWETGRRKPIAPDTLTPALARPAGVFVSLHEGAALRGCVGNRCAQVPLAEAVPELALCAALDDSRFSPLRQPRQPVEIEISILTPMKRLRRPADLRLGLHGAYLASGSRRSLLLPQVARGRDWTTETFLAALARKAGLSSEDWSRPDVQLSLFEAQVFANSTPAAGELS